MILTINSRKFTFTNVMSLVRKQTREGKQVGATCRGALFCGYFGSISRSEAGSMTHSPATWINLVDEGGG
jgi:hypothetical protein